MYWNMIKITETEGSRTKINNKIFVSEVQIEFINPSNGMIAFASIVINDSIYLSSIAIHKKLNTEGYRITYPNKGKGQFSIFYPINKEVSKQIEEAIFNKLNDVMINKYGKERDI
jgi:DNA-binding cell septation regulator SpoVG